MSAFGEHAGAVWLALAEADMLRGQIAQLAVATSTLSRQIHEGTDGLDCTSESGRDAYQRSVDLHATTVNLNVTLEQVEESLRRYAREITGG